MAIMVCTEKITGDNRRLGMDKTHTYLVRFDFNEKVGWMKMKTFETAKGAETFIANLKTVDSKPSQTF